MADRRIRRSGVTTTRRIADRRVHGSSWKDTKLPSDCEIGLCLYQTTGCNTWGWWASTRSAPASTTPRARSCMCLGGVSTYSVSFFQAEDGIRDYKVTGVQTCALPI